MPCADLRMTHDLWERFRLHDPDIEAFIRARIDTQTFTEAAKEVNAALPPNRRTRVCAICR